MQYQPAPFHPVGEGLGEADGLGLGEALGLGLGDGLGLGLGDGSGSQQHGVSVTATFPASSRIFPPTRRALPMIASE